MQYKKATHVLPKELLKQVQSYVDGEYLYIPRASEKKKQWGTTTATRLELEHRNESSYQDYLAGIPSKTSAERYFLSIKSVQRIVRQMKQQDDENKMQKR